MLLWRAFGVAFVANKNDSPPRVGSCHYQIYFLISCSDQPPDFHDTHPNTVGTLFSCETSRC